MISDMQNASREEKIDYLLSREKGATRLTIWC